MTVSLYPGSHTCIWWTKKMNPHLPNVHNSSLQRTQCLVKALLNAKTFTKNVQKCLDTDCCELNSISLQYDILTEFNLFLNNVFVKAMLKADPLGESLTQNPLTLAVHVPCSH